MLELGCGLGDLLASLEPSRGVGVDFSSNILNSARSRHPHLEFIEADVQELDLNESFEFVLISLLLYPIHRKIWRYLGGTVLRKLGLRK